MLEHHVLGQTQAVRMQGGLAGTRQTQPDQEALAAATRP